MSKVYPIPYQGDLNEASLQFLPVGEPIRIASHLSLDDIAVVRVIGGIGHSMPDLAARMLTPNFPNMPNYSCEYQPEQRRMVLWWLHGHVGAEIVGQIEEIADHVIRLSVFNRAHAIVQVALTGVNSFQMDSDKEDSELGLAVALAFANASNEASADETAIVVAALACHYPSGITQDPMDHTARPGCVYIDLPTGQVAFYYPVHLAHLFLGLPVYTKPWDGHSREEAMGRIVRLSMDVLRKRHDSET